MGQTNGKHTTSQDVFLRRESSHLSGDSHTLLAASGRSFGGERDVDASISGGHDNKLWKGKNKVIIALMIWDFFF